MLTGQKIGPQVFCVFKTLKDHKNLKIENEHENLAKHGFSDIQTCTVSFYQNIMSS